MRRTSLLGAAAALCLLGGAAGCGGGDDDKSEAEIKAELVENLRDGEDGLDEETAECFADVIIEEVGVDELRDVDLTADEPPEEIQEEVTAAGSRAVTECDFGADG